MFLRARAVSGHSTSPLNLLARIQSHDPNLTERQELGNEEKHIFNSHIYKIMIVMLISWDCHKR